MTMHGIDHLAIQVPDLRVAEAYYLELFDARVACREALVAGEWRTLPYDAGWAEADAAGVGLELSFLVRDAFELALFASGSAPDPTARPPQVLDHLGIRVDREDLTGLRERAARLGCRLVSERSDYLHLEDRYGIEWEARPPVAPGLDPSTGARTGRWIALGRE